MPSVSLLRPLIALGLLAVPATAQIGDRADKPGEVQKSLVPANLVPAAPALTPDEALKSFTLAPGLKLEIVACEPLVEEPVAAVFGPDGRLWVVEMRGYMPDLDGNGEEKPVGRVVVLRDRDGDGRYDESTVFVDNLVLPRALALVGDGVLVGAPPELTWWRDTDGDGKADKSVVVATDYGVKVDPKRPHLANPERAPNSLRWAFDNWIYSAAYTKKFRFKNGEWETGATIFRGQWGLSEDSFGRFYHNSNSDQLRVDVIFSDYLQRNPNFPRLVGTNVKAAADQFVWPARVNPGINRGYRPEMLRDGRLKEFTAAGAPWIYGGDLFPEWAGNAFVSEPAGNFVRRNVLTTEAAAPIGRNAYDKQEFIASTDERFRPVNFTTGPDGALYVVDLYRGVLQHRISLTSYLRAQSEERQLVQPRHLGRIYRVVPADRPAPRATQLPALTSAQWVEKLSHPNSWWRETAQRLLVERRETTLAGAIKSVALRGPLPVGRVHALWTLDGIGALDEATVKSALADRDSAVRAAAVRLSERFIGGAGRAELIGALQGATNDASAEVQLQAVLTLGEARDAKVDVALAEVIRRTPGNPYLRDALFSGLANRELALIEHLAARSDWPADDVEANKIFTGLARGVFTSRNLGEIERLIALTANQGPTGGKRVLAVLDGFLAAAAISKRPLQFAKEPAGWATLGKGATPAARLAKLNDIVLWPGKTGVTAQATVAPMTREQQERFETGKGLFTAICSTCHQTTGRGLDGLAPPLLDSEWVLGSPERAIRIVLHGVRGPITVAGRVHTGDMPAFGAAFDDQQLASVLTYVRREWGHTAAPVEPAQVKAIRAATLGHSDAWSPEELNLIK